MQLYAENKKKRPVKQSFSLAGYLNPQQDYQLEGDRIAGKNVLGRQGRAKANGKALPKPSAFASQQPQGQKSAPEQPSKPQAEQQAQTGEAGLDRPLAPADKLREMGLVAYPDPSPPPDSPFKQAEERHEAAIDAAGRIAKAGALAQTFSAIADAATLLSRGKDSPVAVGHDRTGAALSQDAANRLAEEDRGFQAGLSEHFNRLFSRQRQKDHVRQANVQMLNQAKVSDFQTTIGELREQVQNMGGQASEDFEHTKYLLDTANSLLRTASGQKAGIRILEQLQQKGIFDENLDLNPDYLFRESGIGRAGLAGQQEQVAGFTETGEVDPEGPQAFELMQAEVGIADFQRLGRELEDINSQIAQERDKEVPDTQILQRLENRQSQLQSQIESLKENEYVQRWDTQNRYGQLQQERMGDLGEQRFDFMHGQRGQIDHDRMLDMSYDQALRSLEGDSPDMSRAQDYIGSVRRGKFQRGGLSFEEAAPHLERIDDLLEKAGYDEPQRRGALNRIIKEDFGIDMEGGETDTEQGEQIQAQEASIFSLPTTGQAAGRDDGPSGDAGFEDVYIMDGDATKGAIDRQIPQAARPAAKRMARHARIMAINREQLDHDNESVARRARRLYDENKEKLDVELDRVKNLDPDSQYRKWLEGFVDNIEAFKKSLTQ